MISEDCTFPGCFGQCADSDLWDLVPSHRASLPVLDRLDQYPVSRVQDIAAALLECWQQADWPTLRDAMPLALGWLLELEKADPSVRPLLRSWLAAAARCYDQWFYQTRDRTLDPGPVVQVMADLPQYQGPAWESTRWSFIHPGVYRLPLQGFSLALAAAGARRGVPVAVAACQLSRNLPLTVPAPSRRDVNLLSVQLEKLSLEQLRALA